MMTQLHAAPNPCNTCPYRKDTPPGVWAAVEYLKLLEYDADPGPLLVFHCHQESATGVPTVCRGWLSVHPDTLGVRLALASGWLSREQRDAPVSVPLYASGAEACEAGLAGVEEPGEAARAAVEKLARKRAGRLGDDVLVDAAQAVADDLAIHPEKPFAQIVVDYLEGEQ